MNIITLGNGNGIKPKGRAVRKDCFAKKFMRFEINLDEITRDPYACLRGWTVGIQSSPNFLVGFYRGIDLYDNLILFPTLDFEKIRKTSSFDEKEGYGKWFWVDIGPTFVNRLSVSSISPYEAERINYLWGIARKAEERFFQPQRIILG